MKNSDGYPEIEAAAASASYYSNQRPALGTRLLSSARSLQPRPRYATYRTLVLLFCIYHLFLVDTSIPAPLHPSSSLPLTSSPRLIILQSIFISRPTLYSRLKGLVGQSWPERDLYQASVREFEKYAETWGFGYHLETHRWVSDDVEKGVEIPYLNKVHAVLALAKRELDKGDGNERAEWIIQDHNGFNSGVLFWRVTPDLIYYLESALAYESNIVAETGRPPSSDQHLYCYALQHPDQRIFAEGVYEVPQRWFNGYFLPQKPLALDAAEMAFQEEGRDVNVDAEQRYAEVAVMIHLVNWRKWQEKWKRTIVRPVKTLYARATKEADKHGVRVREVFERSEGYRSAKIVAESWWRYRAWAGISEVRFNEY